MGAIRNVNATQYQSEININRLVKCVPIENNNVDADEDEAEAKAK